MVFADFPWASTTGSVGSVDRAVDSVDALVGVPIDSVSGVKSMVATGSSPDFVERL